MLAYGSARLWVSKPFCEDRIVGSLAVILGSSYSWFTSVLDCVLAIYVGRLVGGGCCCAVVVLGRLWWWRFGPVGLLGCDGWVVGLVGDCSADGGWWRRLCVAAVVLCVFPVLGYVWA